MLLHRQHLDEAAPVERPRVIGSTLPPLPLGAPPRSVAALRELRAADRALGLQQPTPKPRPNQSAMLTASGATVRTLRRVYDVTAAELEAALSELAELAPYTAKAVAL